MGGAVIFKRLPKYWCFWFCLYNRCLIFRLNLFPGLFSRQVSIPDVDVILPVDVTVPKAYVVTPFTDLNLVYKKITEVADQRKGHSHSKLEIEKMYVFVGGFLHFDL